MKLPGDGGPRGPRRHHKGPVRRGFLGVGLVVVSCALAARAMPAVGQSYPVTELADCEEPCPGVELILVATIGGEPTDPVLLNWLAAPRELPTGGYITSRTFEEGSVAVYDTLGGYVRSFGRDGGGPGEFRGGTWDFYGPRKQVWIVDGRNTRITVVGSEGDTIRTFPFAGWVRDTAPLGGEHVVVLGGYMDEGGRVTPGRFHVLDHRGRHVRSFGEDPIARFAASVYLTPAGTLLTHHLESYTFQEWALDGDLLRLLTRQIDGFEVAPAAGPGNDPSEPRLLHAPVDSAGWIWAMISLPTREPAFDGRTDLRDLTDAATGLLEVIDLESGRVVARQELEHPYLFPHDARGHTFITPRQDEMGYVRFEIYRAEVQRH